MSNKIQKRKLKVPIYEAVVNICIVENIDDMQAYLDKKTKGLIDVSDSEGCVFDWYTPTGIEYYIVFVAGKLSHNLVAHEVYHLACRLMRDVNINDEESVAWLLGYVTENIYKVLKAKNYKIDK